jgi:DNA modification methylase
MDHIIKKLESVDWNFSDYNSQLYPADINFMHWYPGSFVPQIPAILINLLSNVNQLVLDPFAGSGITLIEASKQKRRFLGVDLNPYAVNIVKAKFDALSIASQGWCNKEAEAIKEITSIKSIKPNVEDLCVNTEVVKWFHPESLNTLLQICSHIHEKSHDKFNIIRKALFSSILNRCCSQREHYTYITDRCFPHELTNADVQMIYLKKIEDLQLALLENSTFQKRAYGEQFNISDYGDILLADSRKLNFIDNNSVDLVVTSPPYLCVNDYVRSMHLMSLFFHEVTTEEAIQNEVGARRKRHRKNIHREYVNDMMKVFDEIFRVLKPSSFFCLIIGQGRGKAVKSNLLEEFEVYLRSENKFSLVFSQFRKFKFRRIQVPGIENESILVFQRKK